MQLAITGRSGEDLYETVNRFRPELDAREFIRLIFDLVAKKVETELVIMPGLNDLLSWLSQQDVRIGLTSGSNLFWRLNTFCSTDLSDIMRWTKNSFLLS